MKNDEDIGELLKRCILASTTLGDVAKEIGYAQCTLNNMLCGVQAVSPKVFVKLLHQLGISKQRHLLRYILTKYIRYKLGEGVGQLLMAAGWLCDENAGRDIVEHSRNQAMSDVYGKLCASSTQVGRRRFELLQAIDTLEAQRGALVPSPDVYAAIKGVERDRLRRDLDYLLTLELVRRGTGEALVTHMYKPTEKVTRKVTAWGMTKEGKELIYLK